MRTGTVDSKDLLAKASGSGESGKDTKAPSKPDDLKAVALSNTQVKLTWKASKDNVAVVGYKVYRSTSSGDKDKIAFFASASASEPSFTDSNLDASTKYYYRVSAYDAAANESEKSGDESIKPSEGKKSKAEPSPEKPVAEIPQVQPASTPQTPPPAAAQSFAPGTRVVLNTDVTRISSSGNDSVLIPKGAQGTVMGNSHSYRGEAYWPVQFDGVDFDSACDSSTCSGVNESIYASYNDNSGYFPAVSGSFISIATTLDTQPPTVPGSLRVSASTPWQAFLSWTPSTDNVGVAGYRILRKSLGAASSQYITAIGAGDTTYADGPLLANTTYTYQVYAYDIQNNGSAVASVNVTTPVAPGTDTQAPVATITSPLNNATTTGVINITANATDNVGVVKVTFKLDNNITLGVDTSAPYTQTWDSYTVANGNHTLIAVAQDAAGNISSNLGVTVKVANGLNPAKKPWENFDLSHWKLQLTGSSTLDVRPDQYNSYANIIAPRFFTDPIDGSMAFWLDSYKRPASGTAWRTELRELVDGFNDNVNWYISASSSHNLKARLKLRQTTGAPIPAQISVLQIHAKTSPDAGPLLRVAIMDSSTIKAYVTTDSAGTQTTSYVCRNAQNSPIVVGFNQFDAEVRIVGTNLKVFINGFQCVNHSLLDGTGAIYWQHGSYFKAGNYSSNVYDGYGQTQFYSLTATHQ